MVPDLDAISGFSTGLLKSTGPTLFPDNFVSVDSVSVCADVISTFSCGSLLENSGFFEKPFAISFYRFSLPSCFAA